METSPLIRACEDAWAHVRALHPEVPAAVIRLGCGSRGRQATAGAWGRGRWQEVGGDALGEVMLAGESLHHLAEDERPRVAEEVLATLLHEAAHALATVRRIQETSDGGRWHNRRFRDLAFELGLECEQSDDDRLGWADTRITDDLRTRYAGDVLRIARALRGWRRSEKEFKEKPKERPATPRKLPLHCGCVPPLEIAATSEVRQLGVVVCSLCGVVFQ